MISWICGGELPDVIMRMADAPAMRRLAAVGMHCGCDHASFPIYRGARGEYTRLAHSIGVARIIWHFTRDIRQTAAGLLHDIATPVFAHTIDFLNGDHMHQESTEHDTRAFIQNSPEIMALAEGCGLCIGDICDYHLYPIADNDTPMLSADRLEYTLGNAHLLYHEPVERLHEILDDLFVAQGELAFRSLDVARRFTQMAMRNSRLFVSDEDRYAMQCLADLLRRALDMGVIAPDDLCATEPEVIAKLRGDGRTARMWAAFAGTDSVVSSRDKIEGRYGVRTDAKRRYIDPLVCAGDGLARVSRMDGDLKRQIDELLNQKFDRWVYGG